MIPKIIHYAWFGDKELPENDKKCIESWKKYCPDYKIMLWNEKNFDVNMAAYSKESFDAKKFAFFADYIRLYAIKKYGGIYLDTDVEILGNIDSLLENKSFIGFQNHYWLGSAIMGGEGEENTAKWINEAFEQLNKRHFLLENGKQDLTPAPTFFTSIIKELYPFKQNNRLQKFDDLTVYPLDFFFAQNFYTGKTTITENTVMIHKFAATWLSKSAKNWLKVGQKVGKVIGENNYSMIIEFFSIPEGKIAYKKLKRRMKKDAD